MSLVSASNVYLLIGYAEATNSNVQYNIYFVFDQIPFYVCSHIWYVQARAPGFEFQVQYTPS